MTTENISISSELMKNYKQTALMAPEKKFEALQTHKGNSLLFSIGTDSVFYVTTESPGHATGWEKFDLSSSQLKKSFPQQNGLSCKTFEVAQSAVDGTIGMAMVMSDGTYDHLFLSLKNSNVDTQWINNPTWTYYPFDNPTKEVIISNVLITETINNTQYIVVDILRDPSSTFISRYYMETSKSSGPFWMPHDIAVDLEANKYTSCLGRQYLKGSPHQPTIDGLYTSGNVNGIAQFVFQPLYNVFNPSIPASSARLQLPGNLIPDAMASCRKEDMSTDLYACSQGGLYYFASDHQNDGATAVLLASNVMFDNVKKIYARQQGTEVILWGLNGNDEIFYTTCTVGQEEASPSQWSYPLPIVTNVDLFSPYINTLDGQNTFFAGAASAFQKFVKSSTDSTWSSQHITLPSLSINDTQKYSSYTTRIQVTDENGQALVNTPITISANTSTPVYINHLYYVVDSIGIQVNTDNLGSITVVEWVENLVGTTLHITGSDNKVLRSNPMDKPFNKLASLSTAQSLKNAKITNDDGTTRPFIPTSVSNADLKTVAQSNTMLGKAYKKLSNPPTLSATQTTYAALKYPSAVEDLGGILVDAGDLFNWLKSGVEAVVHLIEDAANDIWHFVAKIAGKVYTCIIHVVEQVVAAATWIYNAIKTVIKDIILFLEFLFEWQDILVTHRVMKNVFTQFAKNSISSIGDYKTAIVSVFQSLQNDVNKWANIPNFDQTPASVTGDKPLAGQNGSAAQLGVHHFQGGASNATSTFKPATLTASIFEDLLTLLQNEETTLTGACTAIKTDIIDQFNALSVTQIIEKFIAIVVDSLLQTAENVLLAVVAVFTQLANGMVELMTETIHIPVISWLYKELTGDDLSFLDLICLIAAIPTTIVYKIASGSAPFPKHDAFTEGLISATSFQEIQKLFYTTPQRAVTEMLLAHETPVLNDARLKVFAFTSGIFTLVGSAVLIVTSGLQRILQEIPGTENNKAKKTIALLSALGNIAYVSPNIAGFINAKTSNWYQQMNNVLTGISIVKGFVNIPISVAKNPAFGYISAGVESVLNIVWCVPVIMNISDHKDQWNTTYKSLIPESVGNFSFCLGGIMEFPIEMTKDIKAKAIESAIQYTFMAIYGICMPIAGGIYAFAPNQNHNEASLLTT